MCILFIYRGTDPDSDYRLIIATNRDESYDRPATYIASWDEDPSIIGGRDMEKGREGGSWLVASPERARVAVLLNLTGRPRPNGIASNALSQAGRGNIVTNFVKSTISAEDYFTSLDATHDTFNNFNLVTVEIGNEDSTVKHYTNLSNEWGEGTDAYLGYGNTLPDTPLQKVKAGRDKFKEICKRHPGRESSSKLIEELIDLLKWEQKHLPDEELKLRAPYWYEGLASVFVQFTPERYGTRTHSIILVDKNGKFDFVEWSMEQPVNSLEPKWHKTHLSYTL